MAKNKLTVLAVCGSGVVSSSIISQNIENILKPLGVETEVVGLLPVAVESYGARGEVDFMVTTSPIPGMGNVPVIKAVALLTAFGEDMVIEETKKKLETLLIRVKSNLLLIGQAEGGTPETENHPLCGWS